MKKIHMVFATVAFALVAGAGNSSFAPAKEKLTEKLHSATVETSDCL